MGSVTALGLPFRRIVDIPRIGTEVCPDPPFEVPSDWDLGTGVTYLDPGLEVVADASEAIADTVDDLNIVEGRDYQVTVVVDTAITEGDGIVANIGGSLTDPISAPGTHVLDVTAGATTDSSLERTGSNDFEGTVSAFHIKPVLWG